MDDTRLTARVRALAASDSQSFSALSALAGLNPTRDFRFADLSGVDLRDEDLRAFDFTNASFRGAKVLGAQFNNTVRAHQLKEATASVRGLTLVIGEALLTELSRIHDVVSPHFDLPHGLATAIRQVDADRERRQQRSGAYIGDSSDLVRRRLSRPFREYLRTLPARAPALILFQPEGDFDFDTLNVVIANLRRSKREPFVFMFPQAMDREASGGALVRARLEHLPKSVRMNLAASPGGQRAGIYAGATQTLSQLHRSKEKVFSFLSALSWSLLMTFPKPEAVKPDGEDFAWREVTLLDGVRMPRESLIDAIDRTIVHSDDYSERHVVFMRSDAFERSDAETLARRSRRDSRWDLASFPVRSGFEAHFFILSGPAQSSIWEIIRMVAARP